MKPYYEHGGITIYHGDCREVLPHVTADHAITDPPYNAQTHAGALTNGESRGRDHLVDFARRFAEFLGEYR